MINLAKFILNFSSFVWIIMLFVLSNLSNGENFLNKYFDFRINCYFFDFPIEVFYFIIAIFINVLLYFCINYFLKNKTCDNLKFEKIYPVYSEYVASYFAVCATVFSMSFLNNISWISSIIICIFLFFVFYMNNIGYLNPFLYVVGKRIYKVESNEGNFIIIIDKSEQVKKKKEIKNLIKIDENVFYHIKKDEK